MANTKVAAYDQMAIWGTGDTAEAAIADVSQWVDPEHVTDPFETAVMTPELAAIVASAGGNTAFGLLPDGRLGTHAQAYAAA